MWMGEKGRKKRKGKVWTGVRVGDAYLRERQVVVEAGGRENILGADILFNDQERVSEGTCGMSDWRLCLGWGLLHGVSSHWH